MQTDDGVVKTHVFDVRARVDGDDITVLDSQVVAHNTVQTAAAVIEVIVTEDDQNSVLSLLSANENCITTEELEGVHGRI